MFVHIYEPTYVTIAKIRAFNTPSFFAHRDLGSTRPACEIAICPVCCDNYLGRCPSPSFMAYRSMSKEYMCFPLLSASPACHLLALQFTFSSCPVNSQSTAQKQGCEIKSKSSFLFFSPFIHLLSFSVGCRDCLG